MNKAEAIKRGLDAHARATAARREVDAVLGDWSAELAKVVGGVVRLAIDQVERPRRAQNTYERLTNTPPPSEKTDVLSAHTPGGKLVLLADVEFGALGYPVTVRWADQVGYANDKAGLEAVLTDLFASAHTGEKLQKLMATEPASS